MWITPVWQTAIAVFSGIIALVMVPTMLDVVPSAYYTIPQYSRDAIVNYWLPQTTLPFDESTSQIIVKHDLPHNTSTPTKTLHTTLNLTKTLTSDGSTFQDYTWVWWLLPTLGVFATAFISIYCIWSTMMSIKIKRRAADHDFTQRSQGTSSTASQPALISVPGGNMPGDIMEHFSQEPFIPDFMAKFDDYKKECDLHMAEEPASTKQNAKDLYNQTSETIAGLTNAITHTSGELEESIRKTNLALDVGLNQQETRFTSFASDIGKLRMTLDELDTSTKIQGRSLATATWRLEQMEGRFQEVIEHINGVDAVFQNKFDVKLSYFKEHVIKHQLDSQKKEAESAIATAFEQSVAFTKRLEQRISSLEHICRDLVADNSSKKAQIGGLQEAEKKMLAELTTQDTEIKALKSKIHDGLQDCGKTQQAILEELANKLDPWKYQMERSINDLQQQQKKLLDGLNGARAELQRLTGAEPKRKRQRAKARSAAEEPPRKGAEDSAVEDQISEETPSAASPNRNPHTPTPVNQPECRSEELPTSPPTGSETTDAGLKEKLAHDVPVHPSPTPCETEEQAKVQDTGGNLEASQPSSPKLPADYQTMDVEPEASSNLTGDGYYDILGIQFDATPDAIKKAYKKRAKELHPDKNAGNDTAQEDFTLLSEAYEVLYDSKQRELYDQSRISGTPFKPVPASDGFVFDPNPAPPAMTPVASDTVRHFLEKKIEERIDRLKKAKPDGWKLSTMAARPIALAQLLEEEPDQPWPES